MIQALWNASASRNCKRCSLSRHLHKPHRKDQINDVLPLNVGRNMEEIKRALIALQTAEKYKVAMPLNWKPGEKVIVPPPKTVAEMLEREASDYEMVDFYLSKKELT